MDVLTGSESVRNSDKERSLPVTRNACQLCGVASTKAVAGTSGDECELRASLEWLHGFLVHLNCLEEGEKRLLDCTAADICENCKSNLKFAKKHGERAVGQHEKVKRIYEEFTDELQTLQEVTRSANLKLQKALEGAGKFQGELASAIGKAFDIFKGLQDSTVEVISFLGSKFTGYSGLFPIPSIGAENKSESQAFLKQQEQGTDYPVKVEGGTGTGVEASDSIENKQNVDPVITCEYSIANCYVEEETTRNEKVPTIKVEPVDSPEGSNLADNQIPFVFLESSDEDERDKAIETSGSTSSVGTSASGSIGVCNMDTGESSNRGNYAPLRTQEKRREKKRKLTEVTNLTSETDAEKKNSYDHFTRDANTTLTSAAAEAQVPTIPAPALAGPSNIARRNETSKKMRMSPVNLETSVEVLDGNGDKEKQTCRERLCVKIAHNSVNVVFWDKKLKWLNERNESNAFALLKCMAYLEPDCINKNLLYSLSRSIFDKKRNSVQEKVDAAIHDLLKHDFIQIKKFDNKTVLSISSDLQKEVKANLGMAGRYVLFSLMMHFLNLRKQNEEDEAEVILRENIEHVLCVWKCAIYYPNIIRYKSNLLCDLLEILQDGNKSMQEEGIKLGEIGLGNFKTTLNPHHQDCFRLEKIISVLLYKVGKYEDSVEKLKELSKNYEKVLKGKVNDLLLEVTAEQGEALVLLGRYEEALSLQRFVLEKTIKRKGKQSMDTLIEENRYGWFSLNAGKLPEALELFKSVEEIARKVRQQSIKLIVEAKINVAYTYSEMGEDEEALKMWEDAYNIISSRLERHPRLFAEISSKLVNIYLNMNKFTEALGVLSTDYDEADDRLGEKHYWTLQLLQSYGTAHRGNGMDKNELYTALEMHEEAYQGLLEINGEEDEKVFRAKNDIALDLSMLGRHDEALQLFKEIVSKLENKQRFSEFLMKVKLNYVEALQRSGESLEEVMRQLEAIKVEFEKTEGKNSRQIKRAIDLINRVRGKMQSVGTNDIQ